MPRPLFLSFYLGLSTLAGPAYRLALRRRVAAGKEVADRIGERFGRTRLRRPEGKLVWFHAASVGESQALLRPIETLLAARDDVSVLVTTTTRTSAARLSTVLPDRAIHQFSPIDTPQASVAFLDHWCPDAAIWTESEIWPRMIVETSARGIPMHLVNARVSPKTARAWRRLPRTMAFLLDHFTSIAAQDETTVQLMVQIGVAAAKVSVTGSTKEQAAPLACDQNMLAALATDIGDRPVWVAASTHRGEEEVVLDAHRQLKAQAASPLLILVPRHPERGADIAALCRRMGFRTACRALAEPLAADTSVYIADTLGELGLWYRLAKVAFIGGSLEPVGGHNPFEPVMLDCAVVTGRQTFNFATIYQALIAEGAALVVDDGATLAAAVARLWQPGPNATATAKGRSFASGQSSATDNLMALLATELAQPRG